MALRWFLDLAFAKNVCVGRVHQLEAGPDPVAHGSVQKQAPWQAYGMADDWQDTNLGNHHPSRAIAMSAVVEWYEDRRLKKLQRPQRVQVPCSAHSQFRPGCHFCEELNRD